jgi:hypothetical protein
LAKAGLNDRDLVRMAGKEASGKTASLKGMNHPARRWRDKGAATPGGRLKMKNNTEGVESNGAPASDIALACFGLKRAKQVAFLLALFRR